MPGGDRGSDAPEAALVETLAELHAAPAEPGDVDAPEAAPR